MHAFSCVRVYMACMHAGMCVRERRGRGRAGDNRDLWDSRLDAAPRENLNTPPLLELSLDEPASFSLDDPGIAPRSFAHIPSCDPRRYAVGPCAIGLMSPTSSSKSSPAMGRVSGTVSSSPNASLNPCMDLRAESSSVQVRARCIACMPSCGMGRAAKSCPAALSAAAKGHLAAASSDVGEVAVAPAARE